MTRVSLNSLLLPINARTLSAVSIVVANMPISRAAPDTPAAACLIALTAHQ